MQRNRFFISICTYIPEQRTHTSPHKHMCSKVEHCKQQEKQAYATTQKLLLRHHLLLFDKIFQCAFQSQLHVFRWIFQTNKSRKFYYGWNERNLWLRCLTWKFVICIFSLFRFVSAVWHVRKNASTSRGWFSRAQTLLQNAACYARNAASFTRKEPNLRPTGRLPLWTLWYRRIILDERRKNPVLSLRYGVTWAGNPEFVNTSPAISSTWHQIIPL